MAEQLFPSIDVPAISNSGDTYDREYKRSPAWDPDTGDFVLDGSHKMIEASGAESFQVWCLKMSSTERFKCLAYCGPIGDQIGVEMDNAVYDDDHATVESMMRRTITEALMVNPRTIAVEDFSFFWEGDTVNGSCIVKAYQMDDFTLKF